MTKVSSPEARGIHQDFKQAVNMTASELEQWLKTEESLSLGQTRDREEESIGHQSGKKIVEILRKKARDLTQEDVAHMRRVVSYTHRHLAQMPKNKRLKPAIGGIH